MLAIMTDLACFLVITKYIQESVGLARVEELPLYI